MKLIRNIVKQHLGYLNRVLGIIDDYRCRHPGCLEELPARQKKLLQVIRVLYSQQVYMYRTATHKVPDRIVSVMSRRIGCDRLSVANYKDEGDFSGASAPF